MSQLTLVTGGDRALDLSKVVCGHLYTPQLDCGQRRLELWLFEDDKHSQTRRVLVVQHFTTLGGGLPRSYCRHNLKLTTIYGYDPQKNCWGPEERTSRMEMEPKDAARLYGEARTWILDKLVPYQNGPHYYLPR